MLKPEQMSPAEMLFIRTYVSALRRDFNTLNTALALMHPGGLDVHDAVSASRMAVELQHMQAKFERVLTHLPACKKFIKRSPSSKPSLDDLADLFSLSFFKIFTTVDTAHGSIKNKDVGWFSGKPGEWHKLLLQMKSQQEPNKKTPSAIFNTFAKLFKHLELFKNFPEAEDTPMNFWPPYAKDKNYDDDDYEEDDEHQDE